jgi:TadE-like protein
LPQSQHGQSLVEFALVAPVLIIMLLAIVDLARVYTTMVSVESAAREAADFGTFGSQKWDPSLYSLPVDGTEAKMLHRACVAASDLPDYVGPDDSCTNPSFSYELSGDRGLTWGAFDPLMACDDESREPPCWIRVTLTYDFKLISPLHIDLGGSTFGLPSTLTLQRSSVFPMTDLSLP